MVAATISAFGYLVPIFAFLLVFIVVYALLAKTGVLGDGHAAMIFISLILAAFFVIQASFVEFIEFSNAWFGALIIGLFFLLVILAFLPGKEPLSFLTASSWFSWVVLGIIIAIFIISSAYVFNWALNWELIKNWFSSDIVGLILLLVIAAVISWKIKG